MSDGENMKLCMKALHEMVDKIENLADIEMLYGMARAACNDVGMEKAEEN